MIATGTCAFVTGASGFLGRALVAALTARGVAVRALVRPSAALPVWPDSYPTLAGVEWIMGDLREPNSYRPALTGCAALYHVAAMYTHDPVQIAQMEAVNIEGTRQVLTAGAESGVPRLLYTGTIGVIGQPKDDSLATEETPFHLPAPSAYVRSKRAGEEIALALAAHGAPVVIVHPTAMLGAGDARPTASGRRVLDVMAGRTPPYPRGGMNWCPVADVAAGMILAAERGVVGRRYILGHRQGNLSQAAFVALIRGAMPANSAGEPFAVPYAVRRTWLHAVLGPALRAVFGTARRARWAASTPHRAGPERLTCDPSRAITELGMPQSSLTAAAQEAVAWYRMRGDDHLSP